MPTDSAYVFPPDAFTFEPVKEEHLPMLREWLSRPHVRKWWEDPETEIGYLRDMLAGKDSTRPYIFLLEGRPCGYIQCWFVGDVQKTEWVEKEPWLADLPCDAVGVDVTIADVDKLSRGIGSSVVRTFVNRLIGEGFDKIIIDPDPANTRAVRAYEKAGFVASFEHEGPEGRTLIMEYDTNRSGMHP